MAERSPATSHIERIRKDMSMSNHFTGLDLDRLGPRHLCTSIPLSPGDRPARLILNAKPSPTPPPRRHLPGHRHTATCARHRHQLRLLQPKARPDVRRFLATGDEARSIEALGEKVVEGPASLRDGPNIVTPATTLSRRRAQRCVLLRLRRDQEPVRHDAAGTSPPRTRGVAVDDKDSNTSKHLLDGDGAATGTWVRTRGPIWGAAACARTSVLLHVDRAGHPRSAASSTPTRPSWSTNASEPINDPPVDGPFVHLMGHTGATAGRRHRRHRRHGLLPTCSPTTRPSRHLPQRRVFTDDVINIVAFLSKGDIPPTARPHTTPGHVPYLGTPHPAS